jgi:hypothetical protein
VSLLVTSKDERTGQSAVVEDDGRVCWAYLLEEERIVADVWLYNRVPAPGESSTSRERPPLNPAAFASPELVVPITGPGEVEFRWLHDQPTLRLDVVLRGVLFGRLVPGARPGWARLAARDGPCAKVLAVE